MFALWPGDQLNFSIFKLTTFGFVGQHAASEAGHIANTNVAGKPSGQDRNKNDLKMKTDTIDKQNEQQRNWVTHPTKRNLLIIVTIWCVGNGLLILSTTDLFTERFINKKYVMIYAMMIMSTWTTFKVLRNYSKTRGTIEQNN
jgi:hypothetical protein